MDAEGSAELLRMLGAEGMQRFLGVYLSESRRRLQDLIEGTASGDAERVRDAAHALIPTSRWVGATELADLCEQLHAHPGAEHKELVRRITQVHLDWERAMRAQMPDHHAFGRSGPAPGGPRFGATE